MPLPKPFDYEGNKKRLLDPVNNRRLTAALFKEFSAATPHITPLFSLEEWGKVYVEAADPTDYKAAMVLLGNWEHWKMVVENQSILPFVEKWREEVAVKLKSEAIAHIRGLARTKDSAAKSLMMGEWEKKQRGRPPKEKEKVEFPSSILDDHKRLGL